MQVHRFSVRGSKLVAITAVVLVAVVAGCSSHSSTADVQPLGNSVASRDAASDTASPDVASDVPSAADANGTPSLDLSKDYGDGITLATMCGDFLQDHDSGARYDAAIRMSSDFNVDSPGNPMWGVNMDSVCGSAPDMTLGDYFGRAGYR